MEKCKSIVSVILQCLRMTIWVYIGQAISHGAVWLVENFYYLLHKYLGDAFPLFSPISMPEKYAAWHNTISFISFGLGMLVSLYFATRFANVKYEYVVSLTDGMYDIKEAFPLYMKKYFFMDAISIVFGVLALLLPAMLIPQGFFTKDYSFIYSFSRLFYNALGFILSLVLVLAICIAVYFIGVLLSLRKWRAMWLCGFAQ